MNREQNQFHQIPTVSFGDEKLWSQKWLHVYLAFSFSKEEFLKPQNGNDAELKFYRYDQSSPSDPRRHTNCIADIPLWVEASPSTAKK